MRVAKALAVAFALFVGLLAWGLIRGAKQDQKLGPPVQTHVATVCDEAMATLALAKKRYDDTYRNGFVGGDRERLQRIEDLSYQEERVRVQCSPEHRNEPAPKPESTPKPTPKAMTAVEHRAVCKEMIDRRSKPVPLFEGKPLWDSAEQARQNAVLDAQIKGLGCTK